jgi:murein L,D-transpeptidase YcbB/YkuD
MRHLWLPLLVISVTAPLAADDADSAADVVRQAAMALGNGDAAAFAKSLDPSMPGFKALRAQATALLENAETQSSIRFLGNTGDNRSRTVQMDWELRIAEHEASKAMVVRHVQATCRVELRGDQWRITRFAPSNLLAPPQVEGAWNLLESAAAALSNGDAASFLSSFAPSMPDYERVRQGAAALVAEGEVQSSIDLIANQGSDVSRTLEVDWALRIVAEDTGLQKGMRNVRVTCRVDLQGKRWRITQVEPADFFGAILLGVHVPDNGNGGRALED